MSHRIRVAGTALAGLAIIGTLIAPAASAVTSQRANQACVTRGEFSAIEVGSTRSQVERQWGVGGFGVWDRSHSDPGHDAYLYRRCGKQPGDLANVVRVKYKRHSRVWNAAELRAHGARVEVVTPIS